MKATESADGATCIKCRNSGLHDPLDWPDEPGYWVCSCPAGTKMVDEFAREMNEIDEF